MKRLSSMYMAALASLFTGIAFGQTLQDAHIGYVYPAGGRTGTTFEVAVGGIGLQKIENIRISGSGVQAVFVEHIGNYKKKLQEQLRVIKQQQSGNPKQIEKSKERRFGPTPEHEMFTRLEELSAREFRQVAIKFQTRERVQRNREINELVILRISIDAEAKAGLRELRLMTRSGGASNPLRFMVNTLPEAREYEPNDLKSPKESHMQMPFIMNGQIMPGDEDHFSFDATKGQQLVLYVRARELVPYLADAVPGWFQAVVAVHDDKGNEVAYADDFLFNPDPALFIEVPKTGVYHVSIRDSIYRGREDFVYRVAVGEIPFVTGIFPLGVQMGSQAKISLQGWNLDTTDFVPDTAEYSRHIKRGFLHSEGAISNDFSYVVGHGPEFMEAENNNLMKAAQSIDLQANINGRIDTPGDIDFYRFRAKKGQTLKVSITARRLHSPVDSLLRVFAADGNVLAWNDDLPETGKLTDRIGLLTHNADSELLFTAPARGKYFIQVSDSQNKGGPAYAYRLNVAEPMPDFELYVTPSSITIPSGGGGKAWLHVKRTTGFSGPIDVRLGNKSRGLQISGGRIPANSNSIPVVISSRRNTGAGLVRLNLVATAQINGEPVSKQVIPADDITQAFITHHLVEAANLSAYVLRNFRKQPLFRLKNDQSTVLTAGKPVQVDVKTSNLPPNAPEPVFELEEAPEGVSMEASSAAGGTRLEFTASDTLEAGIEGNLVVAVYFEFKPKSRDGKKKARKISLGVLPAIPYRTQ